MMMSANGRVHPDCTNACNPYHECGVGCLEKIAKSKGKKVDKLKTDVGYGVTVEGDVTRKNKKEERRGNRSKSSDRSSSSGSTRPNSPDNINSTGTRVLTFDRRHQAAGSEPGSPQSFSGNNSPVSPPKSSPIASMSANAVVEHPRSPPKQVTVIDKDGVQPAAPVGKVHVTVIDKDGVRPAAPVGKYHVRENVAPVLQAIFEKYGDIALRCRLESASMRAYYLQCVCCVVQELHSTPFNQLSESTVKEMMGIARDIQSAQIDVTWLSRILEEFAEAMALVKQKKATEAEKDKFDGIIKSTKEELERLLEDLARKEREVIIAREQIVKIQAQLSEVELRSSDLGDTLSSIKSKIDEFNQKSFTDDFF